MLSRYCKVLPATALLFCGCVGSARGLTIAASTFSSNADGWIAVDRDPFSYLYFNSHSAPVFNGSGGNPGGYIQSSDEDGEWYWRAPSKFLGNVSTAYNGKLTFDIDFQSGIDVVDDPHGVIITGGGITLYGNFIPQPPHNVWTPHTATLNEAGWKDLATNLSATSLQMQTVLSSLEVLDIHGEFGDGPDTSGLDNVILTTAAAVPEPGCMALLVGMAVAGAAFARRRRNVRAAETVL